MTYNVISLVIGDYHSMYLKNKREVFSDIILLMRNSRPTDMQECVSSQTPSANCFMSHSIPYRA